MAFGFGVSYYTLSIQAFGDYIDNVVFEHLETEISYELNPIVR